MTAFAAGQSDYARGIHYSEDTRQFWSGPSEQRRDYARGWLKSWYRDLNTRHATAKL